MNRIGLKSSLFEINSLAVLYFGFTVLLFHLRRYKNKDDSFFNPKRVIQAFTGTLPALFSPLPHALPLQWSYLLF